MRKVFFLGQSPKSLESVVFTAAGQTEERHSPEFEKQE